MSGVRVKAGALLVLLDARVVFLARKPGHLEGYSGLDAPSIINRDAIAELIEPLVINVIYVTLPFCQISLEGLNHFPSFPPGSNLFDYP
jgi:hypothetical protein